MIKKIVLGIVLLTVSISSWAETYRASISGFMSMSSTAPARNALRKAGVGDTVIIDINSGGGEAASYWALVRYINGEKLVVRASGQACSAASFLLMNASKRIVAPGTFVLFHTGDSYGVRNSIYSEDPDVRREAFRALGIMKPYRGLFTANEWNQLQHGEDVVISAGRVRS